MNEKPSPDEASAAAFVAELEAKRPEGGRVPMREIVALATRYVEMDPHEIEKLLDESAHEARIGAVSVMGKQATRKRTPEARKRELYELYLRRIDRIDTWDLVDVERPPRRRRIPGQQGPRCALPARALELVMSGVLMTSMATVVMPALTAAVNRWLASPVPPRLDRNARPTSAASVGARSVGRRRCRRSR